MNSSNTFRGLILVVIVLLNVTISIASNSTALSGRLTVGGPNANYSTITAAINDLKLNGMSADVVIDINQAYGPYIEQVNIESIPGLSASAKLTIKGNNSIIKNTISGNTNVYIIKLAASNVKIDGLIFEVFDGVSSDKNVAIICTNNSNYNQIINNKFKLKKSFSNNNQIGIFFNGVVNFSTNTQGDYKYNIIDNNIFEGSRNAIFIMGKSASIEDRGNQINNNKFSDYIGSAIYSSYVDSLIVDNNEVFQSSSFKSTTHTGLVRFMYISNGAENFKIRNNIIHDISNNSQSSGGFHAFYFVSCGVLTAGKEAYIENNIIYNSGSYGAAIFCYVSGSLNGLRVLHNSFALKSPNLSYIFYLSLVPNFNNNHFHNNLFNSTNNNVILFGIGANSYYTGIKSDNNAYCTNFTQIQFTSTFGYQSWRTNYFADSNSKFITQQNLNAPYYLVPDSFSTLLGAGKNVSTTHDYWNTPRNNFNPSIGAFEKSYTDNQGPILTLFKISPTLRKNSRQINDILQYFDPSGIDTTFGIRFYFKKRSSINKYVSNTNTDDGWKYVKPITYNSLYTSFYLNYQLLKDSIVNAGDTIDYFIIARDKAGNYGVHNNKLSNPFLLNKGVEEVIREITPDYYVISEIIPDTVYVGPSHKIKSLTKENGLFSYLKSNYANKAIQVIIDSDLVEDGKYGLEEIPRINGKSNKLYIDTKSNKAITIQGSCKGGLIRFEGVDSVYWSEKSDSITVRNNYNSLKNDTIAAFYIGANNLDKSNTSNVILIKNTTIQTNPNSIYTTGIFLGKKKGVVEDQSYNEISIVNNKFNQSKSGLVFSYGNSFPSLNYMNFKIIDNEFDFDSVVNFVNASYTSSLLFKGNIVKANHLSRNLILVDNLSQTHKSIFYLIYPFGTTNISSNKIILKNSKDEGINVFNIVRGYDVNVNNNIVDLDVTKFNINSTYFYSFESIDNIDFVHNANFIRNDNYDNGTDDIYFIRIIDIDNFKLRNNQFVNFAKHQSFNTRLFSFISTRPVLFIRNNYISRVYYTDDYFVNSKISLLDFQKNVDPLMNFIYEDANINSDTYKSQNNSLITKGVNAPEVLFDIEGKSRKFIPTVGPFELDSIKQDVEVLDLIMGQCIDSTDLNYKIAVVVRNNSSYIDSAKVKINISSSDTSTLNYQFICDSFNEHEIDTVYIPFTSFKNYISDTSLNVRLELLNDQINSNNQMLAGFNYGRNLVSTYIPTYIDTICNNSQIEIDLIDALDRTYKWYDASEYGNLLYEGKKYIVNNDSKLNIYAEVQDENIVEQRAMPLVNGTYTSGTYFNIRNTTNAVLSIKYISLQRSPVGYYNNTKVYVKKGTYIGFENNSSIWTELNVRVITTDNGYIGFEFLDGTQNILGNDSISFYVHILNSSTGAFINDNITNGIYEYNTQDFKIRYGTGAGGSIPFGGNLGANRRPSVKVYYTNSAKCNYANRVPINIQKQKNIISNIKPISQSIIKSAGTYNNPDVICYYTDNIYSIDISDDFKNYVYNQDWVITRKEVKRSSSVNPDNLSLDTSRKILINKSSLIVDSIYKLTYWYTDKISGCSISISRYFKFGRFIGRSLALSGTVKKCSFDSLELNAYNNVSYLKYIWSTGDTTKTIYAKKPGKYFLTTYFPFCFQKTDSIIVEDLPEQDSLAIYADLIDTCRYKFFTDVSSNYTVEWDFGDGTKAVGFEVFHKYALNTIYKVQLRRLTSVPYCLKKNISEQLVDVTCLPVGDEILHNENLLIYPNPTVNMLYFDSKMNIDNSELLIFNSIGQLVDQGRLDNSKFELDYLKDGLYHFKLSTERNVYRGRFIVKK